MRTPSTQDYLKAIYMIQQGSGSEPVNTTALAAHMNVACASVTGMLKKLASTDPVLVDYQPYGGVRLTSEGEKAALEVIRHHRLLESYLTQALGYSWDTVHEEAERLEHFISEELEERMSAALGHPHTDPHGEPIPDREGRITPSASAPLSSLEPGQNCSIQRVSAHDPALLRYLESLGMTLQARLEVTGKGPFNGPLHIRVQGQPDPPLALSRDVTDNVFVAIE